MGWIVSQQDRVVIWLFFNACLIELGWILYWFISTCSFGFISLLMPTGRQGIFRMCNIKSFHNSNQASTALLLMSEFQSQQVRLWIFVDGCDYWFVFHSEEGILWSDKCWPGIFFRAWSAKRILIYHYPMRIPGERFSFFSYQLQLYFPLGILLPRQRIRIHTMKDAY